MPVRHGLETRLDRLEPAELLLRRSIAVPCLLDPEAYTLVRPEDGVTELTVDLGLERAMIEHRLAADPPHEWELPADQRTFEAISEHVLLLPHALTLRWSFGPTFAGACVRASLIQLDRDDRGRPLLAHLRVTLRRAPGPAPRRASKHAPRAPAVGAAAHVERPSAASAASLPAEIRLAGEWITCGIDPAGYHLAREASGRRLTVAVTLDAATLDEATTVAGVSEQLARLPDTLSLRCPPWPPFAGRCAVVRSRTIEPDVTGRPVRAELELELEELPAHQAAATTGSRQVRRGDTLQAIAHDHFGDASRWREIAMANEISDPASLKPGTWLRLPGRDGQWMADGGGSGVSFPVHVDHLTGGVAIALPDADVEQAMHVILDTAPGERMMRPEFGCAVHDMTFETIGTATLREVDRLVRGALEMWEPRVEVLGISSDVSQWRSGTVSVSIEYRTRQTGDVRTLVHTFDVVRQDAQAEDEPDRRRVYAAALGTGLADTPASAYDLAALLEADGDPRDAEALYQRAIASQDEDVAPRASFSLGRLLERQDDRVGARAAYRFAADSHHPAVAEQAAAALAALSESPSPT